MIKKTILVIISLIIGIYPSLANGEKGHILLKGQVLVEETGDEIPYVTITIQDDSSTVITRQASDGTGKFSIPLKKTGKYQIILSAVGYNTSTYDAVIETGETSKDLGKITMKEGVELNEVSVVVQKPLIKSDPDKLIYSVEADPEAKSNTLMEMLRKVPLLSVDGDGNVTLNGQDNYKVLVNGKSSSLMSNNFKEVIKSMPANSIKDIEVITNPSSKYEAEGVGGIINIITAKNTTNGYNGSVGLSGDIRGGYGGNAYLAATFNKFSFSMNYFSNQWKQPRVNNSQKRINRVKENNNYVIDKTMNSTGRNKSNGSWNGLNFEASYEIDTFNLISASANGNFGGYNNYNDTYDEFTDRNNQITQKFTNTGSTKYGYGYLSGNIDYQRSFPKKDKTMTASYKLDYNPDNAKNYMDMVGILEHPTYKEKSNNKSYGMEHTFQLDYFDPLSEMHQIEAGVKGIYRLNFSETDRFDWDFENNLWEENLDRRSDLDYKQYIAGAYAGYQFKLKKTSLKAGLRGEYTMNDGLHKSTYDTTFTNKFFNLIPYVNFTYAIKPTQTLKASYTQRIFRPGIWALNPYEDYNNAYYRFKGNPELEAEVSHSFGISYGHFTPKFNLNVELNSSFAENSIQRYSYIQNNIQYTSFDNIGTNQRYGANIFTSFRPSGKFSVSLNTRLNYIVLDAKINDEITLHNDGFMGWGNINVRMDTWKGGSVSVNGGGGTGWVTLQGKMSKFHYSGITINQKLIKDKFEVALNVNDPFSKKVYYSSRQFTDPRFESYNNNERLGQNVRLTLTYRFGKMNAQVKKARRGIHNDDKSGGDQGGGGGQGGGQ